MLYVVLIALFCKRIILISVHIATEVLGALAAIKGKLDEANAVGEKAEEVKQYIDMFEVTVAMIPKRNSKGDISKPKEDSKEEEMSPLMKELTFLLPPETIEKMNQFKNAAKMARDGVRSLTAKAEAPKGPKYVTITDETRKKSSGIAKSILSM